MIRRLVLSMFSILLFDFIFSWADEAINHEETLSMSGVLIGAFLAGGLVYIAAWIYETPGRYDKK